MKTRRFVDFMGILLEWLRTVAILALPQYPTTLVMDTGRPPVGLMVEGGAAIMSR